jgi:hypothetical protein
MLSYAAVFWLCRKSLYWLYACDTGRYEVVQVVCGENGAHCRAMAGEGWRSINLADAPAQVCKKEVKTLSKHTMQTQEESWKKTAVSMRTALEIHAEARRCSMTYRVLPPTRRPIDRLRFLTSHVRGFFPYSAT